MKKWKGVYHEAPPGLERIAEEAMHRAVRQLQEEYPEFNFDQDEEWDRVEEEEE